ncbi:polysaccharide biosynthesis tyrosine autokinase [Paraflavitalea soli]|uniref:Polysaccharide biosynthesis tyrosine autokinase n=1 Tax=Paraflavitalea soli TaxID=2315862 RepID=A0A3B7MVK0_9BACT|nr:tyrosine-protein kinase [Paraflavitalea soli]AXY77090.1 polysaccharide biosynthesis tyrosine autokinase [Paraflavitalea soli]
MTEATIDQQRSKPSITPRELIFKYIRFLPWLIVSVILMLAGAYIKLRYSTPVYSVSGKLLVNSQTPYSNAGEKFDDIFMMQRADKLNDEIEIIKSRSMASRVVRSLGLEMQVNNKGKIRSTIIHPRDVPFQFNIVAIDSTKGFSVLVTLTDNDQFRLNENPKKYFFNELVQIPGVSFRITPNNSDRHAFASNDFAVSWVPTEIVAATLSGNIGVARVTEGTNVLYLTYQTENVRLGMDIVNQYMKEYQQGSLEDKREIAGKTLAFINSQKDTVFRELRSVEGNLQKYRQENQLYNAEAQTNLLFDELSESNKEAIKQGVSLRQIDYNIAYLSDSNKRNEFQMISSMLGVDEPSLADQVITFNRLQLERETALKTIPAGNPTILNMEAAIERLRKDIIENLRNVRQTHVLALNEVSRQNTGTNQVISSIPAKEKQLLEVTRQQAILQELYSYLLQKQLETALASASTISNIKVVEPAMSSGIPVSPNRRGLYIMAFAIGIAVPVAIIFLLEYLNDKVKSKAEIQQMTSAPILGEVGHADHANTLVVTGTSRKFLAEQFRIIRSNLQYILPKVEKPAILVTSSFSGEGKSFVSTNLGSVLALSGKRTVILEFDIRKPKILKGLGLHERKGITNYIVSNIKVEEVIHPVPSVENLFVVPCGPVPPNPAEMLLNERVELLFRELRNLFDVIIVDTAPIGLVSDAMSLGRFVDATVYIVRHNYTMKKQIQLIEDIYQHNKLPHLSIIINDIDTRSSYGGYGYGGYGYGYGYGYGLGKASLGYFESENGDAKRSRLRRWFSRSSKK